MFCKKTTFPRKVVSDHFGMKQIVDHLTKNMLGGSLKRSARAVQLFGRLAVLETHTLRY